MAGARKGIEVTVMPPGFVDRKLAGHVAGPRPFQMTAERAARITRRPLDRGQAHIALGCVKVEIQDYE